LIGAVERRKIAAAEQAMIRYGQYCPIAKALELLAERWTLLIVRELLMGSRRFNDLRRGVPLMSPSVLSQRLKELQDAQVIAREAAADGHSHEYRLTPAGEELRPLLMQLGTWGQRWYRSAMDAADLDASFLMWDIRRNLRTERLPARAVVAFEFDDAKKGMQRWWLVVGDGEVDLCLEDPGRDVDVWIAGSLRAMAQVWMGDLTLVQAQAAGSLRIGGAPRLVRHAAEWLGASPFAQVAAMPAMLRETAGAA
jgi:DNA-binding HxlR family transcriptional regulator